MCSCPHGVSMIMFEPGFCSDPQTDPPSAAPHLCQCMITFPPVLIKNDLYGWGGPTCPKEDRNMDYLIFLILSRDSDL